MIRVLMTLTIGVSFHVIAIVVFVASYDAPIISNNVDFQRFLWMVVAFLLFSDLLALYILLRPGRLPHEDFDAAFKRYYDGTNYDEAYRKAYKVWRERTGG